MVWCGIWHLAAIFLHSTTGPIIESSSNIALGCYNYSYFGLESNLISAEMSVWENEWYSVYDFTPSSNNFSLLPTGDPATLLSTMVPVSGCSAAVLLLMNTWCHSVVKHLFSYNPARLLTD